MKLALNEPSAPDPKPGRMTMSGMARRIMAAASFLSICIALPASAQETVRIRGTVERIEGPVYVVKNRDGAELKLTLTDNPLFVAIVPAKMADGSQKAIEVHIFPESMRGTGEGHYDWDLLPKSKMTNANVEQAVNSVDGQMLSVKYKDGEKKLLVTPETIVVTYEIGKKEEVQPGTRIFVAAAKKQPDGTVQAPRITYGRNGQAPAF
jgi:hypothetical protein